MIYYAFTLKFLTPVHFGDTASGGNLDKIALSCSADTLFAALCNEAAALDSTILEKLIADVSEQKIVFSSLFPYYRTENEDLYLYLPKPLLQMEAKKQSSKSFAEMKQLATKLKKQKKTSYIRASELQAWLKNCQEGQFADYEVSEFAAPFVAGKVNLRGNDPLPYFVGSYVFDENAGLYFLCGVEDDNEEDIEWINGLLKQLGMTGIGGKRSSGYGKFKLADKYSDLACKDLDDIFDMLFEEESSIQMCLAPVCPLAEEIAAVKQGAYKLVKRGGFISSPMTGENMKRDSVYMLAEGSCFAKRLQGSLLRQEIDGIEHPVYRDGVGMFVGLKNE